MEIEYTKKAFDLLVAERPRKIVSTTLFITISPNPRTMVEIIARNKNGRVRQFKRPYGMLRQIDQYQYCMKVLKDDYYEWLSDHYEIIGVPELNETGNIHLHMIINDPSIKTDVDLQMLRRDILNSPRTQRNIIKTKVNAKDWMNNIVYVTESEKDIIDYMMKQQSQMLQHFNNYISRGSATKRPLDRSDKALS